MFDFGREIFPSFFNCYRNFHLYSLGSDKHSGIIDFDSRAEH